MLIVIDGLDGSGKSTQADRVAKLESPTDEQILTIEAEDLDGVMGGGANGR